MASGYVEGYWERLDENLHKKTIELEERKKAHPEEYALAMDFLKKKRAFEFFSRFEEVM